MCIYKNWFVDVRNNIMMCGMGWESMCVFHDWQLPLHCIVRIDDPCEG